MTDPPPSDLAPVVLQGHVLDMLRTLPENSVQCVVTSPPFFGLRRYDICGCAQDCVRGDDGMPKLADGPVRAKAPDPYCRWCHGTGEIDGMNDVLWGGSVGCAHQWEATKPRRPRAADDAGGTINKGNRGASYDAGGGSRCSLCGAWQGQLGLEPTITEYINHLVEVFREVRRVLREDGVAWCEIGDTYVTHPAGLTGEARWRASTLTNGDRTGAEQAGSVDKRTTGLREKNLALIPQRLAIALQDDGWIVRSIAIWNRPNPMPESVRDRPTQSHSYILMMAKEPRYYFDQEAVREENSPSSVLRILQPTFWEQHGGPKDYSNGVNQGRSARKALEHLAESGLRGRNLRSVWTIPVKGYPRAHFATFPEALPERCILASTSEEGACLGCGSPWERDMIEAETVGWKPTCSCGSSRTVPSVVLDPFAGSGTTLSVAKRLGRRSVGIEMNPMYVDLIHRRVSETRTDSTHHPSQRRLAEFEEAPT